MPGLPGLTAKKDLEGMKQLFTDQRYRPDMLKIYPCMVVKDSDLFKLYQKGKFKPITTKQAVDLIVKFKKYVPKYCRIMRVQRDIPTYLTEAGVDKTNLRQYVDNELKKQNIKCNCIRCRKRGFKKMKVRSSLFAEKFYHKCGFRKKKKITVKIGKIKLDEIYMEKQL